MSIVIHAPERVDDNLIPKFKIFLAGSIEMGKAEDWQAKVIKELTSFDFDCAIFNPRRPDWDTSCKQSKDNEKFREQVEWELEHLEQADIIFMYLSPGTISPISLLELGLHITDDMIMCCPEGFARKGNVDIVAERYGMKVYENLRDATNELVRRIAFCCFK